MSYKIIETLKAERDGVEEFIARTLDGASEQERDLSSTEMETLEQSRARIQAIDAQLKPLAEWVQTRASAMELDKILTRPQSNAAPQVRGGVPAARAAVDTLGSLFVASDAYTQYRGGTGPRFEISERASDVCTRAVMVTSAPPGQHLLPEPFQYTTEAPALLTPLLAAINRVGVSTGAVEIVSFGLAAGGAAVVPEGQLKQEGTSSITSRTVAMETIAVTAFASRQLLRDAPAAQQFVNSQMARGVLRKLEEEVTAAITGATVPTVPGIAGEELLAQVRRGQAVVQAAGFTPNVLMANPGRLAALDLTILGLGGATAATVGNGYWGLDAIAVPALADDEVFVADSSAAMTLFERTGIEQFVSDSDVDDSGNSLFRRNILSFVTELAAVAAVTDASAMVKLTPAP